MVREQSPTNKPSSPLDQFAVALSNLLRAAGGYHRQLDHGIDQLETLHLEAQLAAPPGITLPAFRRSSWPADRLDPIPGSTDGGKTWKLVPSYVFEQHGSPRAVEEYIAQLTALADAVQRRLNAVELPEEPEPQTPASPPKPLTHQGVIPPNRFAWDGATAEDLSPLQYRLLECVTKDGALRAVPVQEVEEAVYSGRNRRPENITAALTELCRRTQANLDNAGVRVILTITNGYGQAEKSLA